MVIDSKTCLIPLLGGLVQLMVEDVLKLSCDRHVVDGPMSCWFGRWPIFVSLETRFWRCQLVFVTENIRHS